MLAVVYGRRICGKYGSEMSPGHVTEIGKIQTAEHELRNYDSDMKMKSTVLKLLEVLFSPRTWLLGGGNGVTFKIPISRVYELLQFRLEGLELSGSTRVEVWQMRKLSALHKRKDVQKVVLLFIWRVPFTLKITLELTFALVCFCRMAKQNKEKVDSSLAI